MGHHLLRDHLPALQDAASEDGRSWVKLAWATAPRLGHRVHLRMRHAAHAHVPRFRYLFIYNHPGDNHATFPPLHPGAGAAAVLAGLVLAQQSIATVRTSAAPTARRRKRPCREPTKIHWHQDHHREYNGEQIPSKAMVEAMRVTWDVVEGKARTSAAAQTKACSSAWTGASWATSRLPATVHERGVGAFVGPPCRGFTTATSSERAPTGWADFWDVKKFPGKRGMRRARATTSIRARSRRREGRRRVQAVLGARTAPTRAFKKLGEPKPTSSGGKPGALPPAVPRWRVTWP